MRFSQIENLPLNREIDEYIKTHKEFETREDFVAALVKEKLKDQIKNREEQKKAMKKEYYEA